MFQFQMVVQSEVTNQRTCFVGGPPDLANSDSRETGTKSPLSQQSPRLIPHEPTLQNNKSAEDSMF